MWCISDTTDICCFKCSFHNFRYLLSQSLLKVYSKLSIIYSMYISTNCLPILLFWLHVSCIYEAHNFRWTFGMWLGFWFTTVCNELSLGVIARKHTTILHHLINLYSKNLFVWTWKALKIAIENKEHGFFFFFFFFLCRKLRSTCQVNIKLVKYSLNNFVLIFTFVWV